MQPLAQQARLAWLLPQMLNRQQALVLDLQATRGLL
jgi:hypothetical protein